ncbi:MAG: hypothetical protein GY788_27710 [bacterium]|nr:hypothetical protein [bacterium]
MGRKEEPSLRDQLRDVAGEAFPVPERSDVMARALFALQFAEKWLAEQVEDAGVPMRGGADQLRQTYRSTGQNVEIIVEGGVERRVTGAVEPPAKGWALIRSGNHRDLIRIDDSGMFTSLIPSDAGPIDVVLEFDHGLTMTMKGIGE